MKKWVSTVLAAMVCATLAAAAGPGRKAVEDALELGRAKIQAGDFAGAIADYDAALATEKSSATLYYARGDARLSGGDAAGAEADFKRAIQLTGEWAPPYVGRAKALMLQKKWRAAQAQLRTALSVQPGDLDARYLQGLIATEEGRYAEAAGVLAKLAEDTADAAPAFLWLALANAEVMAGNETAAQIAFARHQKLEPRLGVDAYLVRAYIRYASADYDSCLLDVARVEEAGRSMLFFRDAINFARRDFAELASSFEGVIKQQSGGVPGDILYAHVLRRAAGGGAGAPKPMDLPAAETFAGTHWQPLYAYLTAAPAARKELAGKLAPLVIEGARMNAEDVANFHLLAGIAMENDRDFDEARRQYDLAWAQGGKPEESAWMARQLKLGLGR
jgi:tetratricopeptide (TPR) repeat protein